MNVGWLQLGELMNTKAGLVKNVCFRDEAEGEMRAQLRRQAAAHSDHLADVLSVQVNIFFNSMHLESS